MLATYAALMVGKFIHEIDHIAYVLVVKKVMNIQFVTALNNGFKLFSQRFVVLLQRTCFKIMKDKISIPVNIMLFDFVFPI